MPSYDYLIVGQGLAGSCLAMQLLGRGKKVLVIDRINHNSASRVAAGLFNPVTSKVRVPTWLAEHLFPYLDEFYRKMEDILESNFYFPRTLYRPFTAATDAMGWDKDANPFIQQFHQTSAYGAYVRDPFGGIELRSSGFCDTRQFIDLVRIYLRSRDSWVELDGSDEMFSRYDNGSLFPFMESMGWKAERVIWCEGIEVYLNPLFNWLPIKPLKGEVMLVKTELPDAPLFNRGVYLVPDGAAGAQVFRAGATHERSDTPGNSIHGLAEIESRLNRLLAVSYKRLGTDWGFRPTVPDRRPILGPHPVNTDHWVFNGLGTKGVTLAPFFSAHLAEVLESGAPLMDDVNIRRFYPLYFKSLQSAAR